MNEILWALDRLEFELDGERWMLAPEVTIVNGITLFRGSSQRLRTRLLEVLAGLEPPAGGRINWLGRPLMGRALQQFRRQRTYVPSTLFHERHLSVEALLDAVALLWQVQQPQQVIARELDRWGLTAKRKCSLARLSGGEQRRVQLAMSLVPNPKYWMVDQLYLRLDSDAQSIIAHLASQVGRQGRLEAIIATGIDGVSPFGCGAEVDLGAMVVGRKDI